MPFTSRANFVYHAMRQLIWILAALFSSAGLAAEFSSSAIEDLLNEQPEFLKVDEAFVLSADVSPDGYIHASWNNADGYYLYRHRFEFSLPEGSPWQLGEALIPDGKKKVDEYFGEVEVYYHETEIRLPLLRNPAAAAELPSEVKVGIGYQGCADLGLCYPPETKWLTLALPDGFQPQTAMAVEGSEPASTAAASQTSAPVAATGSRADTSAAGVTEEQTLAGLLEGESMLRALALFFLAGIGLAFTPCVLPMVPILSSIIVGESENMSRRRAFTLSLAYVLGMAITYAIVGVLMGLFGASLNLQAALQSPPVLIVFAIVFVALSFSMFGFYELQLPQSWQNRLNALSGHQAGGKHPSVFIMGAISSLVVSPCVSAPLAGALIYIGSTGDAVLGGGALLALGLGMGLPLLIIGSSEGDLLPRAGAWMNGVKAVFGVGLLAVAIWLLERVIPGEVTLLLWAALFIGSAVYLGALDFSPREGWAQLWKATGALLFVYGILLLIGAASGAEDPLRPLQRLAGTGGVGGSAAHQAVVFRDIRNTDELEQALALSVTQGKPVLLDFYADWCISCKVMERNVFTDPAVVERMNQFTLLRADVTKNNAADKALLEHFGLFGPPSIVFFDRNGGELKEFRIQGEMGREPFRHHLEYILDQ